MDVRLLRYQPQAEEEEQPKAKKKREIEGAST